MLLAVGWIPFLQQLQPCGSWPVPHLRCVLRWPQPPSLLHPLGDVVGAAPSSLHVPVTASVMPAAWQVALSAGDSVLSCHFLPWAFPLWVSCCLWCRIWNTGWRVLLLWLSWGMKRHWKQGDTIMGCAHGMLVAIHCSCSLPQDQWIADFFLCRWYQLFLKLLVDNPFVSVNNWSI